jgi:rubrerythrin
MKMIDDLKKQNISINYDIINVEIPVATVINTTADNLKEAIKGEEIEYNKYYPEFAALAEQHGLIEISNRVKAIAIAERHHKDKFQKLLETITTGIPLSEEIFNFWVCHQCGYIAQTVEKPVKCPSCDYTDSFYQADLGNK